MRTDLDSAVTSESSSPRRPAFAGVGSVSASGREVVMATKHTDSCLQKTADDEPIFVLRARDSLAPEIVEAWADAAEKAGTPAKKVEEARMQALMMRAWQMSHGSRVPD